MNSRHDPNNGHPHDDQTQNADLTAFALDQLTGAERAAVEQRLPDDDAARQAVAETQQLGQLLRQGARVDAIPPSLTLQQAVQQRLDQREQTAPAEHEPVAAKKTPNASRRSRATLLAVVTVAASLFVALGLLIDSMRNRAVRVDSTARNHQLAKAQAIQEQQERNLELRELQRELMVRQRELQELQTKLEAETSKYRAAQEIALYEQAKDSTLLTASGSGPASPPTSNDSAGFQQGQASTAPAAPATQDPYGSSSGAPAADQSGYGYGDPGGAPGGMGGYGMGGGDTDGYGGGYDYGLRGDPRGGQAGYPGSGAGAGSDAEGAMGYGSGYGSSYGYGGEAASEAEVDRNRSTYERAYTPNNDVPLGWRQAKLEWEEGNWQLDDRARRRAGLQNEQYDGIVENDFVLITGPASAVSTFSIDVDTASYANMRRFLRQNSLPPADAVRIEELVNYFQYDYPQPAGRHPFAVSMELARCPWQEKHLLLRIGLKGKEITPLKRPSANIVFLLDVSGSMKDENKLPLLKQAMKLLTQELSEDDQVTIVTYAGEAGLRLDTTSGHLQTEICGAIDSLQAGGSTNGSAGIELAYQKATEHFLEEGVNRVILATDGDLNVGISDDERLVELIKEKAKSNVFLTVLGFGTGNLKDSKLEKLADHGNGVYGYVDSLREARKVLVEQLSGSLVTIAKDVKLQLEFNPAEVRSYRLIGYENRVLAAQDFHDDTKDAGDIGAGHTVTALYELEPAHTEFTGGRPGPAPARPLKYQQTAEQAVTNFRLTESAKSGELLTLALRYKPPEIDESTWMEVPLEVNTKEFAAATDDFRFAAAVAAFGMRLRGSQHCGQISLQQIEELALHALGEDAQGRRTEFVDLVRIAQRLVRD